MKKETFKVTLLVTVFLTLAFLLIAYGQTQNLS